jgi:threonine dehydrogenase-like Zn-dependent dehydrogenase
MKAGVMYGPRDIRFEDVDDLKLTGDYFDVLVKIGAAGICGSDMHR